MTTNEPTIADKIATAVERVRSLREQHNPIAVIGLYSGGHDSCSACEIASRDPGFAGVLHINTGIGVEATREHVRCVAAQRNWPLYEYKATENRNAKGDPDPQDYDALVLRNGFPGPPGHRFMYARLKQRAIERFMRDVGANCRGLVKRRVMFVSGARAQESVRRMGTVELCQFHRCSIWLAPIHDWTKLDTTQLLDHCGIPRNPVVDLIHKSGECLCGAFAKKGELDELALWPETRPAYDRICALQMRVRAAGFAWGWEERPHAGYRRSTQGTAVVDQLLCRKCNIETETI